MPETPVLGLPYPESTDTADVPRDMQALALAIEAQSLLPPGVAQMWFGNDAPAGWALLNGQSIDADANPKLAAIFGLAGDWVILPNMQARFPIGAQLPSTPVRQPGGSNSVMLVERNVPDHKHYAYGSNANYKSPIGTGATPWFAQQVAAGTSALALNGSAADDGGSGGYPVRTGGVQTAVDIRPAFIAVNFIVKLG